MTTPPELHAEHLSFRDEDEVTEAFHARRWTDGLAFTLPTEARVQAMIAGAGRPAGDVIGAVPPRWAEATVENVAINAVMAGCRPEYMPVLLAALEAACDPAFGLYSVQATTHPCSVLSVVTGPVVQQVGLNFSHGVFGPGFRANASIGRALRLVLINVGGGVPGAGDQSCQGSPAKFSACIAENEAATPWEPFRLTRGFAREDSTVTVYSGESPHNLHDQVMYSPHGTLTALARLMATSAHNNSMGVTMGDLLVVLCPEHAHTLARGGFTRQDVQQFLWEKARSPLRLLMRSHEPNRFGNYPKWVDTANPDELIPITGRAEDIHVLVSGGPGPHSSFVPTFGFYRSVTRRIGPPAGTR
ncbi:MAG: hypothetical protein HY423_00105 [Candidatus Lambdaproteobacteria bacterium]|nr:hypothetical protein [Candidatus Lambdaproteobacteria bacterium]